MTNLVQKALSQGGRISSLVIPAELTEKTGLMNPSIFTDSDGDILVNLRHVNYTLYHSEHHQQFPSRWGPLAYLHPESYQKLATTNYICKLNPDLEIEKFCMVDTSELDVEPLWDFVGLEDARLTQWDGDYYLIGVRRDTTTNGQGRMELSKIELDKENWTAKEVSRLRIPAPVDDGSYCEKNWVPVLDKPYHFVKWTSPTELVRTYPEEPARCEQVTLTEGVSVGADQRGSSHVVRWGEFYISVTHEVYLFNNYLGQKDGVYRHRFAVWDDEFNLIGLSPEPLSFLEGRIEFCAGAAVVDGKLLISFGFQDNAAFVVEMPKHLVDELIGEALPNV
jgi:predicted GH43/DUF377 family glycosyl hydrolase